MSHCRLDSLLNELVYRVGPNKGKGEFGSLTTDLLIFILDQAEIDLNLVAPTSKALAAAVQEIRTIWEKAVMDRLPRDGALASSVFAPVPWSKILAACSVQDMKAFAMVFGTSPDDALLHVDTSVTGRILFKNLDRRLPIVEDNATVAVVMQPVMEDVIDGMRIKVRRRHRELNLVGYNLLLLSTMRLQKIQEPLPGRVLNVKTWRLYIPENGTASLYDVDTVHNQMGKMFYYTGGIFGNLLPRFVWKRTDDVNNHLLVHGSVMAGGILTTSIDTNNMQTEMVIEWPVTVQPKYTDDDHYRGHIQIKSKHDSVFADVIGREGIFTDTKDLVQKVHAVHQRAPFEDEAAAALHWQHFPHGDIFMSVVSLPEWRHDSLADQSSNDESLEGESSDD
jgi:hypothetical protein